MKAAVIYEAGGPEVLKIEEVNSSFANESETTIDRSQRPIPKPKPGWVLIRIKAFGLNRSELFTRQGHSPGVPFPRILDIEATGLVEEAPGGEFQHGDVVATAMGGMGRAFDGGYAEYTCVPASQIQKLKTNLPWEILGGCGEMLQTAYGSLFNASQLKKDETLLVRGGTTSVGMAAAAIAKNYGCTVHGTSIVVVDDGSVAEEVKKQTGGGVNKVLELIGTTTLLDSLQCVKPHGIVCMMGMVGNSWSLKDFSPMDSIPTSVCLTCYDGGERAFMSTPLQQLVDQIEAGTLSVSIGKTFKLDDIVEAHKTMGENRAGGKIVVLT
ncbi:hypothetical protein LTS10_005822 [Elasticomyces elasticus]|nr:hypothetical protein LTS10_005822 [Elasticomyces elasticus]